MTKINFQNLPNTTTPINATNLNQLQTNTENAINNLTNAITVRLNSSQTNASETSTVVFDTTQYSLGSVFTLQQDGGIKCNSACDIEINATLRFGYSEASTKELLVYKNSTLICNLSQQEMTANTQTLSSYYLTVAANDVIYLKGKTSGENGRSSFVASGTHLSLRRIN